jgi:hypothetical protein
LIWFLLLLSGIPIPHESSQVIWIFIGNTYCFFNLHRKWLFLLSAITSLNTLFLRLKFLLCVLFNEVASIGWLCTRWGEIAQGLKFKYLYKSHCKSCELLRVLYNMVSLKSLQQFVGFAVTLLGNLYFTFKV